MSEGEPRPSSGVRESTSVSGQASPLPTAWQPFTFRGVAAFSRARLGRVLLAQSIVALLIAASVVWFLQHSWYPRAADAARALPASGVIENQVLTSPRTSAEPLAADGFMAISLNLQGAASLGSASDVRIEFHSRDVTICSLFGCASLAYPPGYTVQFNQPELEAWLAAWRWTMVAAVVGTVVVFLFLTWIILAVVYAVPVWLASYFKDRSISLWGSWKLSAAALLAPGVFVAALIVLYGLNALDLLRLLLLWLAHIPLAWVYLYFAVRRLPSNSEVVANPFTPDEPEGKEQPPRPKNPFSSPGSDQK